jgi:hypothetical protein
MVDATDLKSVGRKAVRVQVSLPPFELLDVTIENVIGLVLMYWLTVNIKLLSLETMPRFNLQFFRN